MSENTDGAGAPCLPAPVNGDEDPVSLDQPEIDLLFDALDTLGSMPIADTAAVLASNLDNKLELGSMYLLTGELPLEVDLSQTEMELLVLGLDRLITTDPQARAALMYRLDLLIARRRYWVTVTANLPGYRPADQFDDGECDGELCLPT